MRRLFAVLLRLGGAFWLSIGSCSVLAAEDGYSVDVTVSGADANVGTIIVSLFDLPERYLKEAYSEVRGEVGPDGRVSLSLDGLAPGEYAVVVIYDKNDNGKLDTGLFGIPKEKIGYSNNARGRFGPAKWGDTRFSVIDADRQMNIILGRAGDDG